MTPSAADGGAKTFMETMGRQNHSELCNSSQVFGGDDDTIISSVITDAAGVSNTKGTPSQVAKVLILLR